MGEDFTLEGGRQTYHGNQSAICVNFRLRDDRLIESNESLVLEIHLDNSNGIIIGNNRTIISIEDNDCKHENFLLWPQRLN